MNESNPWITRQSETVYDNPWIKVTEHQVVNPGGHDGIYGVVEFKNIATGAVVLDREDHTWLVGQHRYPLDAYSWELPEGGGPYATDPLETIRRELKEETGIEAARWDFLMKLHLSNCVSNEEAWIYLARELTVGEASPDDDECLALKRVPFDEAYAMVLDGRITDAVTAAGIMRVQAMKGEGTI